MPTRVDETLELHVVEDYLQKTPIREISKTHDVSVNTVYAILKRRKISIRSKSIKKRDARIVRFCVAGETIKETAKRLHISEKTISRTVTAAREQGESIHVHRGRPFLRREVQKLFIPKKPINPSDLSEVDNIVKQLIELPFPYPQILDITKAHQEFRALQNAVVYLENDEIRPWSPLGARICIPHFPNRYFATWKNLPSAVESWCDKKMIRKAVLFQLRHGDPVHPHRVLRALTLQLRTPTVFRPIVAKFVYDNFCPKNGLVWDPCAGYGGRLLGALVAGVRYLGTDVDPETVRGNLALAQSFNATKDIANVILSPAENFKPPEVDLVFTSPPYFDRERYSDEENQSWMNYKNVESWIDGFLRPMARNAFQALRRGSYFIINIADLKEKVPIPLVSIMRDVAANENFILEKTLKMPLAKMNRHQSFEPVLVFKKL